MKSLQSGLKNVKVLLSFLLVLGISCYLFTIPAFGQDQPVTDETDLSTMDWSDESEQVSKEQEDLSAMDWSDESEQVGGKEEDLSQMDWGDESEEVAEEGDLAGESWEDDGTEEFNTVEDEFTLSKEDEIAQQGREQRIHIFGFILFIGYLLGGVLTAFFSRNRKIAIDYPPELLILLHTLWPIEWLFLTFAGKKVR